MKPECFGVLYPYGTSPAQLESTTNQEICICVSCSFRNECYKEKIKNGPMNLSDTRAWLNEKAPGVRNTGMETCLPIQQARIFFLRGMGLSVDQPVFEDVSQRKVTKLVMGSLTTDDNNEIRELYNNGMTTAELAGKYGVPAHQMRGLLKSLGCKLKRGRTAAPQAPTDRQPTAPAKAPVEKKPRASKVLAQSHVTAEHGKEIERLYKAGNGVVQIYKDYGRSLGYQPPAISAYLKDRGFEIKRGRKKK